MMRTITSARPFHTAPQSIVYDFIDEREHRKRMFFEDVPHIIQYGASREDEEKTRIGLWRCGRKFNIVVEGANIRGTKFYKIWRPLMKNNWDGDKLEGDALKAHKQAWNDHRARLFDLIIHSCLPLMQSIAPVQPYWITLQDFLHGPTYDLQLVIDPETGEPRVEQTTAEMKDTSVYCYQPKPMARLGELPPDLPRYAPQDVLVEGYTAGKDWFDAPRKIRLRDGRVCYFMSAMLADIIETRDESLNTLRAFLQLHQSAQRKWSWPPALPKVVGIVVDRAAARDGNHVQETDDLIAGLLLTWLHAPKRLSDIQEPSAEQMRKWRKRILDTVTAMHTQGISPGTTDDWGDGELWEYCIGYTILIDAEEEVWMDVVDPMFAQEPFDGRSFAKAVKMDLDRVEQAFPGLDENNTMHARL